MECFTFCLTFAIFNVLFKNFPIFSSLLTLISLVVIIYADNSIS